MPRRDLLPGGRAAGRSPSEFDPAQLRRGIKVELEHTPDRRIAREIAMDHLTEDPRYYTKLARVHLDGVGRKTIAAGVVLGFVVTGFVAWRYRRQVISAIATIAPAVS